MKTIRMNLIQVSNLWFACTVVHLDFYSQPKLFKDVQETCNNINLLVGTIAIVDRAVSYTFENNNNKNRLETIGFHIILVQGYLLFPVLHSVKKIY